VRYDEVLRARLREIRSDRAAVKRGEDPRAFIPTGLRELDRRSGIKRGVLTIFGAATGEGKSILKLHLATAAAKAGHRVLMIDMEDPLERTADRTLSTFTDVNNARIAAVDLTDREEQQLARAVDDAGDWAARIDVRDGLATADEALAEIIGTDADEVLVDYLQGFPDGDGGLERTIARFCWDLNKWAQDERRAAVAFSQVTAGVEQRGLRAQENAQRRNPGAPACIEGFRPFGASDLAWCSAAGQRCKELGFMFRPNRYRRRFNENVKDDVLELSFPKRNWGVEGTIRIGFDGKAARLYDLDEKEKTSAKEHQRVRTGGGDDVTGSR
jgi:replicative DNA helicase